MFHGRFVVHRLAWEDFLEDGIGRMGQGWRRIKELNSYRKKLNTHNTG